MSDIFIKKNKLAQILRTPLALNTLWMSLSIGVRIILQAAYFIVIARALGVKQYGVFVSVIALVGIIAPFANFGSGNLLVKNVSREPGLINVYWAKSLVTVFILGTISTVLLVSFFGLVLPITIDRPLIFCIAVSDLIFANTLNTAGRAFQSFYKLKITGVINISINLFRLLAAVTIVSFGSSISALDWSVFYLASTFAAALFSFFLVQRYFGSPKFEISKLKSEIAEGFFFSVSIAGQNVYNLVDRVMLSQLSTFYATGIYGSAIRFMEPALVPIRSLLQAAFPDFFIHGKGGIEGSLKFAKRLIPLASVYGLVVGFLIFIFAPVIPFFVGDEYAMAIHALRWMAPIPFLKAMHFFASDTLSGAGLQGRRSLMLILTAFLSIMLNFCLIPLYSWKGAVWSSLITNAFLVLSLWLIIIFHVKKENKRTISTL